MGRFYDHISEAINNTKNKQCMYLNNAIRKYGKDNFTCKLLYQKKEENKFMNNKKNVKLKY